MGRRIGERLRRLALLGVALHTLVVAAAPFEHHDLICHLKTPQHCTSCASSPVGSSPHAQPPSGEDRLADAGTALHSESARETLVVAASHSGRSPPRSI
jgi:hypothetical protein